jgi:hypothetical protein
MSRVRAALTTVSPYLGAVLEEDVALEGTVLICRSAL